MRRWTGAAGDGPLAGDPPALTLDTERLRGHIHEHPEPAVFVPVTQMAQAAEAAKRPDWGLELAYGRRGSAFSDIVSLQFKLAPPIFTRTRQDPQIAAKRQELNRVKAQCDSMLRDHTQDLDADLAEYEMITRQLARLQRHIFHSRSRKSTTTASYRAGNADVRREWIDGLTSA